MTVPAKYITLSNGLLTSQKTNVDGTRTDTWKSDLPFAPYLLFMGVGDYAIIKDKYKNKEVNYYVEKEYAPLAKRIFGNTPEMMAYFSRITGVDYPWQKYAQIVGRDYIFGAMENMSATLHAETAQQDSRELVDGNTWEDIIAHELFHQWFGDYVTTESWSNITVNESFADYSETLWNEYKYGKESGEAKIYADLRTYLSVPNNATEDLVRFNYKNVLDAFDAVGYQKGGCILHMLRNYVGDSAFFRSIKLYLTTNKFKSAEAQNLRLVFEEVTGQDLNWFFNQWYYASGHPKLNISYHYDSTGQHANVYIRQTQAGRAFTFPLAIDVYEGAGKNRYHFFVQHIADTFSIPCHSMPLLINVDADKTLVCEKTDAKTADNFMFQYSHGRNYADRREAIAYFLKHQTTPGSLPFLTTALKDKNEALRTFILGRLEMAKDSVRKAMEPVLISVAENDPKPLVRAAAINSLDTCKNAAFVSFLQRAVFDSSYSVAAGALAAMAKTDSVGAFNTAKQLAAQPAKGALLFTLADLLSKYGNAGNYPFIYHHFINASPGSKFGLLTPLVAVLGKEKDTATVKKETDIIVDFRDNLPGFVSSSIPFINMSLNTIATAQKTAGAAMVAAYIQSKVPAIAVAEEIAISPDSLRKYTGQYTTSDNSTILKINLKDRSLILIFPGQSDYPLAYTGTNKFTIKTWLVL